MRVRAWSSMAPGGPRTACAHMHGARALLHGRSGDLGKSVASGLGRLEISHGEEGGVSHGPPPPGFVFNWCHVLSQFASSGPSRPMDRTLIKGADAPAHFLFGCACPCVAHCHWPWHASGLHFIPTPRCACFYNHAHRPRLKKLFYLARAPRAC